MIISISHLPVSVTEEEVRELVRPYGEAAVVRIYQDKQNEVAGIGNGTVHVRMQSDAEAERVVLNLDNTEYKGQKLHICNADGADFPSDDFWN